jgi:hypothetical protein
LQFTIRDESLQRTKESDTIKFKLEEISLSQKDNHEVISGILPKKTVEIKTDIIDKLGSK